MAHDDAPRARRSTSSANTSGIVVPLTARGRTFGAITFGTVPPQPRFTTYDLELAVELGRRASLALDNALLYARGAGAGARGRGARVRRRRRLPRRRRRDRPALEPRRGARRSASSRRRRSAGAIDDVVRDWQTVRDRIRIASGADSRARGARRRCRSTCKGERALALDLGRPRSPAARSTRSAT